MEKSASKRWRESGTTLSFKEWINFENAKNTIDGGFSKEEEEKKANTANFTAEFQGQQDVKKAIADALTEAKNEIAPKEYSSNTKQKSVFGLNKVVLIASTVLIVGSISYYVYHKMKK